MRNYNIIIRFGIVVLICSVFLILHGLYNIQSLPVFNQDKELPIYSVGTDEKKASITIDAAWGDEFTEDILDTLDEYEVKATFFLVEFWADDYPNQVKEIHKRGHEIGNHSATHPDFTTLSKEGIIEEITKTDEKIKDLTGVKPTVFRPPYGAYNDTVIQTLRELDYYTIQWDIDSLDWKELGVESVVDRVIKNVGNGSIILFHNNAKYIKEYLPIILDRLTEEGYDLVPVSELIYKDNFQLDNTGRQIYKENLQ